MYEYLKEKHAIFTEDGQKQFLEIRDRIKYLLKESGAVRMQEAISGAGDSWSRIACVDRLVELGELREISQGNYCPGQYRLFVANEYRGH